MLIPQECIEELNTFKKLYCWVSGGRESTALALELWNIRDQLSSQVSLIHSNTGLRMKSATHTLEKLKKIVEFTFIELNPEVIGLELKQLLIESFQKIPEAKKAWVTGTYDRRVFPCCELLKHKPGREFIKSIPMKQRKQCVFLSGIARYESRARKIWLTQLKGMNKFVHWNKRMHGYYGYPFRDLRQRDPVLAYLARKGFGDTKSTGCRICPITVLFDMWDVDPQGYIRSKKFMLTKVKGVKFCHQQSLDGYLEIEESIRPMSA